MHVVYMTLFENEMNNSGPGHLILWSGQDGTNRTKRIPRADDCRARLSQAKEYSKQGDTRTRLSLLVVGLLRGDMVSFQFKPNQPNHATHWPCHLLQIMPFFESLMEPGYSTGLTSRVETNQPLGALQLQAHEWRWRPCKA